MGERVVSHYFARLGNVFILLCAESPYRIDLFFALYARRKGYGSCRRLFGGSQSTPDQSDVQCVESDVEHAKTNEE